MQLSDSTSRLSPAHSGSPGRSRQGRYNTGWRFGLHPGWRDLSHFDQDDPGRLPLARRHDRQQAAPLGEARISCRDRTTSSRSASTAFNGSPRRRSNKNRSGYFLRRCDRGGHRARAQGRRTSFAKASGRMARRGLRPGYADRTGRRRRLASSGRAAGPTGTTCSAPRHLLLLRPLSEEHQLCIRNPYVRFASELRTVFTSRYSVGFIHERRRSGRRDAV